MSNAPQKDTKFSPWKILEFLEIFFCTVPVAVMTAVIFISVICRYLLKAPLGWAEEFTLCCMVWCIMGGASYAFYKGLNVGVTFVVDKFPPKARKVADIMIIILTIVFMGVLLYTGFNATLNVVGKATLAAKIPLWIPYSAIPVGCVMSILRLLQLIFHHLKESPEELAAELSAAE